MRLRVIVSSMLRGRVGMRVRFWIRVKIRLRVRVRVREQTERIGTTPQLVRCEGRGGEGAKVGKK